MKVNGKVTYTGKPQNFSNTLGFHRKLFPGRCGTIQSISGRYATVEFSYNGEPLDFVIPLTDLMADAYVAEASEPAPQGFWSTLLGYLHG